MDDKKVQLKIAECRSVMRKYRRGLSDRNDTVLDYGNIALE